MTDRTPHASSRAPASSETTFVKVRRLAKSILGSLLFAGQLTLATGCGPEAPPDGSATGTTSSTGTTNLEPTTSDEPTGASVTTDGPTTGPGITTSGGSTTTGMATDTTTNSSGTTDDSVDICTAYTEVCPEMEEEFSEACEALLQFCRQEAEAFFKCYTDLTTCHEGTFPFDCAPLQNPLMDCRHMECGNGNLQEGLGEECDDGNQENGDGCNSICQVESLCGNGKIDPGEDCESMCVHGPVDCLTCKWGLGGSCGDQLIQLPEGETCDDGNNIDGDGCDAACQVEPPCGDGKIDPGEECDDGPNNGPMEPCGLNCKEQSTCPDQQK